MWLYLYIDSSMIEIFDDRRVFVVLSHQTMGQGEAGMRRGIQYLAQTAGVTVDDVFSPMLPARTSYTIDVDPRVVVSLDFSCARILVDAWSKSFVRVTPNEYFTHFVEVLHEHNRILFDLDYYLEENPLTNDGAGFEVKVPESAALSIRAGESIVQGCVLDSVQSRQFEAHNCRMLDNFSCRGERVVVLHSSIGEQVSFHASSIAVKHCTFGTISLASHRTDGDMSIVMKSVRGNGVQLRAGYGQALRARLHHVRLDRLSVQSGSGEGIVILEGARIGEIGNDSKIPIVRSVMGQRRECA